KSGEVFKDVVAFSIVEEVRGRNREFWRSRMILENSDDPVGILVRKRFEQDTVDDIEDRRVSADAQPESKNRDNSERRILSQQPQTELQIFDERVHGLFPISLSLLHDRQAAR